MKGPYTLRGEYLLRADGRAVAKVLILEDADEICDDLNKMHIIQNPHTPTSAERLTATVEMILERKL